jgi:hypothetical protein
LTKRNPAPVSHAVEVDEIIPEDEWLALTDEFITEHRAALEALAR